MTLIDETYFTTVGGVVIGQLGQQLVRDKVLNYVAKYEPRILSTLLGVVMYNEFSAWLAAPDATQRWIDLRDGVDYTDIHGELKHWPGLGNKSESAIANYVYYWYVRSDAIYLSGSGSAVSVNENSNRVSPFALQSTAWNEMVRLNYELFDYLRVNVLVYPEWPLYKLQWVLRQYHHREYDWAYILYNYYGCRGGRHKDLYSFFKNINPAGI